MSIAQAGHQTYAEECVEWILDALEPGLRLALENADSYGDDGEASEKANEIYAILINAKQEES